MILKKPKNGTVLVLNPYVSFVSSDIFSELELFSIGAKPPIKGQGIYEKIWSTTQLVGAGLRISKE
jgi:hypothetical protein